LGQTSYPADHADPGIAPGDAPLFPRHPGAPGTHQPPAASEPVFHGPDRGGHRVRERGAGAVGKAAAADGLTNHAWFSRQSGVGTAVAWDTTLSFLRGTAVASFIH